MDGANLNKKTLKTKKNFLKEDSFFFKKRLKQIVI